MFTRGALNILTEKPTLCTLIISTFCVLKLEAEKNQCPVSVYMRSSDNVCLMELKVLCKCVLCLKERKITLVFRVCFQTCITNDIWETTIIDTISVSI